MKRARRNQGLAWGGLIALAILHLDFWRPQRLELYFGWLPEEIVYRLAWILCAWLYLLWFCSAVWSGDVE